MAHLSISKGTSFNKLVELYKKYINDLERSDDVFEKGEISYFLETIRDFCIMRGGYDYFNKVSAEAHGLKQGVSNTGEIGYIK